VGLDMYLENKEGKGYAYWRKANQINNWFDKLFDGVENLTMYEVNKEILQALVNDCKTVLGMLDKATKVQPENENDWYVFENYDIRIMEIMPPARGFFFGSYEIDEGYEYKLQNTVEQLETLIENHDFEKEPLYYSIWY